MTDKFINALYRKLEEQIYTEYKKITTVINHEWIGKDLHADSDSGNHYVFRNMTILKKTENQKPTFPLGEGKGYAERMEMINNQHTV